MRRALKRPVRLEPIDIVGREAQVLQIIERLFEAGREQKSAPGREPAQKELEHRGLGLTVRKIGLQHVELVKIGEQRARERVHGNQTVGPQISAAARATILVAARRSERRRFSSAL